MSEMKATVLIDNIAQPPLLGEWGLAVYMEYRGRKLLLDTGATGDFVKNADALGIDLGAVEYGVLSHAHYDHADGMAAFFDRNDRAPFFLRAGTAENCYGKKFIFSHYIGIRKGTMETYADRIQLVSGDYPVCPGIYLLPHKTPGLERIGKRAHMYRKVGGRWQLDDFSHEQSLVLDTEKGLVIFNSCSHGGADNIIRETAETFPDKKIYAIIGGFHLFASTREEVLAFAKRVRDTGIEKVVTGHCTGQQAYDLLKQELGDRLEQLHTGYVLEV